MTFSHLEKVARDVFFRKNATYEPGSVKRNFCRAIWTVCTNVRYLYFRVLWTWKNQYGREGMFQNNEKSSEMDNKTHA